MPTRFAKIFGLHGLVLSFSIRDSFYSRFLLFPIPWHLSHLVKVPEASRGDQRGCEEDEVIAGMD
jgi:hypothetical protein